MYTLKRTIYEAFLGGHAPIDLISAHQYHIYNLNIYIIFLRESSQKMYSKTHQIAQLKNLDGNNNNASKYSAQEHNIYSGVVGRVRMGTIPHKKLSGNGVRTRESLRYLSTAAWSVPWFRYF